MTGQNRRSDVDRRSSQERRDETVSMISALAKDDGADRRIDNSRRDLAERRH